MGMPLWSLDTPPTFFPSAQLTKKGWIDPATGELLVALNDTENQIGPGTDLRRHEFGTARIQAQVQRVHLGNAAVRVTQQQAIGGSSRVQTINTTTRTGNSRIQATITKTRVGLSSIRKTNLQEIFGQSSVRKTQPRTVDGSAKVVHRLKHLSGMKAEYPFYESSDPLVVRDYSADQNHATLSSTAVWTELGLQLDGTQSIGLPNDVLVPSNQDFTVFIVAQKEDPLVDDGHLIRWGADTGIRQAFDIFVSGDDQKLAVDLQGDGWTGKFQPTVSKPFAVVARYNAEGRQIDVRVADDSEVATCVGVHDYFSNGTTHFIAENGKMGLGFKGTLIYMATFDRFLSNGEVSNLLRFAYMTLLVRGV